MNAHEKMTRFIANEFLPDTNPNDIPNELNLMDAGIVDSLGLLKIVVFLEEVLNISIEPEQMLPENLCSINAMLALVEKTNEAVE
jgi:acyl carrier protein